MGRASNPNKRNATIPVTPSRVAGFLSWGEMNLAPQVMIRIVSRSPTAKACVRRRAKFIAGNGIKDPKIAKLVINSSGQTMDDLNRSNAGNLGFGEVQAMHVRYNGLLNICSVKPVPFENVRLGTPDYKDNINRLGIFPYLDNTIFPKRAKEFTACTRFNPDPEVVGLEIENAKGIANYPGQLIYIPIGFTGDLHYHEPTWMSVQQAIQTEPELLKYDFKVVVNNFVPASVIGYVEEDETTADPDADGADAQYVAEKNAQGSFESQLLNSIGNENAASSILLKFKSAEQLEKGVKAIDLSGKNLADLNGNANERVPMTIARGFEMPIELLPGLRFAGGLSSEADQTEAAVNLMYQSVNDEQRLAKQTYEQILTHFQDPPDNIDCSIEQYDYMGKKFKGQVQTAG